MAPRKNERLGSRGRTRLRWILIGLVLMVLVLSILAFISPISQGSQENTPTASGDSEITPTGDIEATQTAVADPLPPTQEEIGYTDGIIFMSTLLILILLVGTLRETLHRRGR